MPEYASFQGGTFKLRVIGERVMFYNPGSPTHPLNGTTGTVTDIHVHEYRNGDVGQSLTVTGIMGTVSNNYVVDALPEHFTPADIERYLNADAS